MSIVITTEETEIYKGYRGNFDCPEYESSEVAKIRFHKETLPANEVNKRDINLIFLEIEIKK